MAVHEVYFGFIVFRLMYCAEQLFVNEKNSKIKKAPRCGAFWFTQSEASLHYSYAFHRSFHHGGHGFATHSVDVVG